MSVKLVVTFLKWTLNVIVARFHSGSKRPSEKPKEGRALVIQPTRALVVWKTEAVRETRQMRPNDNDGYDDQDERNEADSFHAHSLKVQVIDMIARKISLGIVRKYVDGIHIVYTPLCPEFVVRHTELKEAHYQLAKLLSRYVADNWEHLVCPECAQKYAKCKCHPEEIDYGDN